MNPSLTPKKMRKTVFILLAFLISSTSRIGAIPAQKGFLTSIQSDGTTLLIQALGDEFFHSLATDDGLIVVRNETGDYCYYTLKSSLTTSMSVRSTSKDLSKKWARTFAFSMCKPR